jgi:hypothetical protein
VAILTTGAVAKMLERRRSLAAQLSFGSVVTLQSCLCSGWLGSSSSSMTTREPFVLTRSALLLVCAESQCRQGLALTKFFLEGWGSSRTCCRRHDDDGCFFSIDISS